MNIVSPQISPLRFMKHILTSPPILRSAYFAAIAALSLAATPRAVAGLVHDYTFDGSYADSLGGPSLVPNGGVLGATAYTFDADQGLTLSNALPTPGTYSILVDFEFTPPAVFNTYRRIVDFKNRTSDSGLYDYLGALSFYNDANGPGNAITENDPVRLVLTRDAGTQLVSGYLNGVQQFSFTDLANEAVFSGPGAIMNFFQDNTSGGGIGEAGPGVVDQIAIYDDALTGLDVAALGAIPEPGTMLFGIAALGAALSRRIRKG